MKLYINLLIVFISVLFFAGCGVSHNAIRPVIRVNAASLQADALEVIMQAAVSPDAYVRTYAMEALALAGDNSCDKLIVMSLGDQTVAVRSAAAIAAGDRRIASARAELEKMISSENVMIRLCAGYALEKMGDQRFVRWYDNALTSDIPQYAGQSCLLLGKLGNSSYRPDSKTVLWQVMNKSGQKPYIRLQAAEALARLGDMSVKQRLLDFAGSGYADDRLLTVSALKLLACNECIAMLSVLADDEQIEVKLSALRGLGVLAGEDDIKPAYKALTYTDPYNDNTVTQRVRHLAILAIGSFGRDSDAGILKEQLNNSSDSFLRLTAAIAVLEWQKARGATAVNTSN
ncbi:MAG: HEAT repeat domain-containing protein [Sedimentisphaerales bacterium]|nr:HEAT repeat domain-containing protein [Sedimentisphaerales bacterium]MBN2843017.1 HEAT repeat domain-containing protein [Sedimentisphaerales bacterium]